VGGGGRGRRAGGRREHTGRERRGLADRVRNGGLERLAPSHPSALVRSRHPPPPTPTPQVGAERYNLFTGCPAARTATLVLRGGSEQFIDEADRSLHDAIMIVRRALKHAQVGPRRCTWMRWVG
jgi:hypothetical protein